MNVCDILRAPPAKRFLWAVSYPGVSRQTPKRGQTTINTHIQQNHRFRAPVFRPCVRQSSGHQSPTNQSDAAQNNCPICCRWLIGGIFPASRILPDFPLARYRNAKLFFGASPRGGSPYCSNGWYISSARVPQPTLAWVLSLRLLSSH